VIDFEELENRFREDEGNRVEHKRGASDLDTLRKAICALANDLSGTGRPGVLFVGQADDKSCGHCSPICAVTAKSCHFQS
jgi:ATP-dependent DNA helicase RecG